MTQEKCQFCNGELATVKGELICTTCGLVNKSALENKERYVSPSFFYERKLKQERVDDNRIHTINQIKSDIAYIINYLELSKAVQNQAYLIVLDILKNERKEISDFPWHDNPDNLTYNCLIMLSMIVAIMKIVGEFNHTPGLVKFFSMRGEILTLDDVKQFSKNLSGNYDFIVDVENL